MNRNWYVKLYILYILFNLTYNLHITSDGKPQKKIKKPYLKQPCWKQPLCRLHWSGFDFWCQSGASQSREEAIETSRMSEIETAGPTKKMSLSWYRNRTIDDTWWYRWYRKISLMKWQMEWESSKWYINEVKLELWNVETGRKQSDLAF